jgi:phosphoglycolate phosphatase
MTMKKLVIFDLDGTLLNTIEDLGQAANYALERNGFATHSMASYPYFVGNGVRRLITRVLPEDARDDETIDRVLGDFLEHYDEHCTDFTKHYIGMPELLQDLRDMGVAMAVASNKYQKAVDKIIPHFFPDIKFIAVEGHREGVNVKPDPSVIFSILSQAKVSKADTLYIGDSGVDMEAGRRACVDTVGVTWGFRSKKELVEYHADAIVNNPVDILDIVDNGIRIS